MNKINNINFDDGIKEFSINNDPNRIIRFNPADIGIIDRLNQAKNTAEKALKDIEKIDINLDGTAKVESAAKLMTELTELLNTIVDDLFGEGTAKAAFGNQSPLSTVKGEFLFVRFIEATKSVIEPYIQEEVKARDKAISKYKGVYDRLPAAKS